MKTCSQKTMTFASNNSLSGMRHALSVPQSAAPRPTSQGPYNFARLSGRLRIANRCSVGAFLRQCDGGEVAARPAIAPYQSGWLFSRAKQRVQSKEALTPQFVVC